MVFMGRGRGRGTSQLASKSGGAISATTRKEKRPIEIYGEDRNRSRSPMSKRPVLQRLGPPQAQPEEMTPSHESLRITVGNDIYKDQRSRSPLSERLGPPVKKTDSYDDMKHHSDERYDQLYGGSDDDRDTRKNNRKRDRYDSPRSPVRGSRDRGRSPRSPVRGSRDRGRRSPSYDRGRRSGSYDRGRRSPSYDRGRRSPSYDRRRRSPSYDRGRRSPSYDRGRRSPSFDRGRRSTSYDRGRRSASYDREWKSSPYRNRDRRSTSRDRDRRDHDRGRRNSFDRYSDKDNQDRYVSDRKVPFEERTDRDREPYKREDYIPDERHQNVQSELINRYRIPETQATQSYSGVCSAPSSYGITTPLQPSVTETGDNKPLKSILKKSAPDPQTYTSDKTIPFSQNIQPDPFGTPANPAIYGPPKAIGNVQKNVQKSQKSLSSLPGMSSYMDIEDEERFLYGDDGEEKSNKRNLSEFTQYKNMDRPSLTGSYSGAYRADERNPAQLQQQPLYPPYSDHQVPQVSQQQPRIDSKTDLLSIFTSKRGPTNPSASDPFSSMSQQKASPTEKKAKYDPTIENILKSIGFDFEMSKRMQEKANPTPFKPKEEMQYGIDQSSSFLGGEISDDIKKEIFPVKSRKESMVDVLLREAKLTSSPSDKLKPLRQDSFPSRERRDSVPKRDRSSYERESSYHDDERDKQKPIPSKPAHAPSSQPVSSSYTTPSTSYTPAVTYPVSSIQTTYGVTSTTASSYPASNTVSGYPYVPPPAAGYTGPPPSPYGMPPPGHPSLWGPPPGYQAYGVRYPYGPPPGYPASYQPYTSPQTTGSTSYKNTSSSSSSKITADLPKIKDTVSKNKTHSNLKAVELSTKKLDDPPPKKAETKTVTVVRKVVKKSESKGKPKGNVVSSTTTSSNRTVIHPKVKTPVKRPADSKPPSDGKEKTVITKVILTTKEKDKLVKEKEQNQQRLKILEQELTSLRKQQNEMMRKRRREKDGHKDPILMQNSILQDEITKQIAKLREEAEEKAKFLNEATVEDAGSSTPKRSRESSSSTRQSPMSSGSLAKKPRTDNSRSRPPDRKQSDRPKTETSKRKDDNRSKDRQRPDDRQSSSSRQSTEKSKERPKVETQKQKTASTPASHDKDSYRPIKPVKKVKYEFFDPGNHWCKSCNVVCSSLIAMLQHLHGKKHQGSVNKYERPWMPDELKSGVDKTSSKDDAKVEVCPIKGQEFFMATKGYYCTLCKEHSGDDISAEYHIKTESHYLKYKDYMKEHPFYEQRLNLDKAAGMSLMKDEEKRQEKKEEIKKEESKPDEKPKEKDPAEEAKILEQKKKMQAIWDKHIKSKQQVKTKINKNKNAQSEEEKEKGKIQINILNKTGIKQAPPAIKKNPVLPPWTPVSKEQKIQETKIEPVKRPSVDNQEPPSLDDFITVGQNEKIPVVRDISKSIKLITAESLLKKISEKQEDKKDSEVVEKKKDIDNEEKKDLEMLSINPDESKLVAEIKLPPPPTQNLSLPTENKDNKMATSSSDEMYTFFFSDDKQVIISTDDKEAVETKASDLVEIDAEANVTLLSEEENEKTKEDEVMEDVEKIPLPMNTDLVVISLDSHSEESSDENSHIEKDEVSNENAHNVDQVSNEIDNENVDKEKCLVEKENDEPDLKMNDKLATSVSNDKKTETVEENLVTNQMEDKKREEITTTNDDIVTVTKDEETTATNVEITAMKEEIATTNEEIATTNVQEAAETIDANVTEEVSSKIEVLPMTQNPIKKGRRRSQRGVAKNVTEVAIVDKNEGNPIEVVGVTKEKPTTETKTENTIQVIQTRLSSSRIQLTQSQKTSPTTIRTRTLSNLHDVINIDDEVETNQSENLSPKKKKNIDGSSPTKKRTTRKSSTGNKIKSKTQSKYVPKKHLQVDIVSISDDEYENVDSASDFSEDEQELENISSSSEKFETNISEHLENVSSDSEIEDNDTNAELENISSDEMEGNIMTVDEVGEVDEFEDFDFNDEANVLDQVGDSDDDMEIHSNQKEQGMEKMELETISDAEDGDFKKDEDKIDGNLHHKGLEKSNTPDTSTGKESTDDISKEEKLIEGDEQDLISKETEKDKDIAEDMVTPVDERETKIEVKLFVEKTLGIENIEQENLALINNEQDTDTETIVEEKVEQTTSTQSTVETEEMRNKISIEDEKKSKTVAEDEITVNINIDQTVEENLGDLSVETPLGNVSKSDISSLDDSFQQEEEINVKSTRGRRRGRGIVEEKMEQTTSTQSTVETEEMRNIISIEDEKKSKTVAEDEITVKINIDQTVEENLGDLSVETPLDNVSKSDNSSLDDSFQQEEEINVKSTRGRRRGRGRGRGITRKTPRRGRSSTKMEPKCEVEEVSVSTEEKEEEMAIEIQEVLSTEDAQKTKSEENVEVVEAETKMKSPKRGRPSKKKQNEMEVHRQSTSEEMGDVLANKSQELEITAEVLETKLQENEINIIVEDTENVNVEQETQKENEIQNNTEGEVTTGNILSLESGMCSEVQENQNNAKDYEVLHYEEKPEVINLNSEDEIIDTEDHKDSEISEISDKKLEESMEINENVDKNSSDIIEIIEAIPEQPSLEIENKTITTDDEHQILIQDDNDDEKDVKISSGELSLDIAEYNSDDETDVLPLDMDELINLDSSTEFTEIIDGNVKVVNSEEQDQNSSQNETLIVENQNRMIEQDINIEIDNLHTDNGGGDVISISDNETESKTDAQESQSEKPVCLELNKDSLETFNLSIKPEISVSQEPSIDSNKNGNASDLFNLDFDNKERLQLFQDDANSNSDNASSSSEIKIDVVLEAIDSLSRIDTGTTVEDEPQAMEDDRQEIPIDTTGDIIEDVSERISEDVDSKNNEENSQGEEDMVVVSSEEGKETENHNFKDIDVDDCASNGSGVSMDMGSDFEVLDECESD